MTEIEIKKVVVTEQDLLCPISMDFMEDPVMAEDGHFYDRKSITDWMKKNNTSPITKQELTGVLIKSPVFDFLMKEFYKVNKCLRPINENTLLDDDFDFYEEKEILTYLDIIEKMHYSTNKLTKLFKNTSFIDFLIDNHPLNYKNDDNWQFIHYVFHMGTFNMIKRIISRNGINLQAAKNNKEQPIHILCHTPKLTEKEQLDALRFLIELGVNLNVSDGNGYYPIHLICSNLTNLKGQNQIEAIQLFLNNCVDADIATNGNWRPIHFLCSNKNNFTDSYQQFYAILLLLEHDINLNVPINEDNMYPIHFLCSQLTKLRDECLCEMINIFISRKVNLEVANSKGMRPIHYICSKNTHFKEKAQLEMLRTFIGAGVQLNVGTKLGWHPIHYVCSNSTNMTESNQMDAIKLLIKQNVNVNVKAIDINNNSIRPIDLLSSLDTTNLSEQFIFEAAQLLVNSGMTVKRIKIVVE